MAESPRAHHIILGEGVIQVQSNDHIDLRPIATVTSQFITMDTVLLLLTLVLSLVLLVFTLRLTECFAGLRPIMAFWFTESGAPVKLFFQKVASYNVFMTLIVHAIYRFLLAVPPGVQDTQCSQPLVEGWLVVTVAGVTLFLSVIRFLAMLLPHSRVIQGFTLHSPPEYGQPEYNRVASTFSKVIKPFVIVAISILILMAYVFYSVLPNYPALASNMEICAGTFPDTTEGQAKVLGLLVVLGALPAVIALAVEHIYYLFMARPSEDNKKTVPGFYLILSSPFVIAIYVTTWSGWLVTMTLTLTSMEARPDIQTTYWEYFAALDSLWMLVLYGICTFKNRIRS